MQLTILCLLLVLVPAAVTADPIDDISESMLTRLEAAELVAEAKYAAGRPVEDLKREAAVIDKAVGFAPQYGVKVTFARGFFQAQMDANKSVQSKLIGGWKAAGRAPMETPPNLALEVRPIYDALTPKLLSELKESLSVLKGKGGCTKLREAVKKQHNHRYYTAFKIAIAPLVEVPQGDCTLPV